MACCSPEISTERYCLCFNRRSIDYFENHRISNVYVSVRKNNLPALYLFEGKGFRKLDFRRLVELYGHRAMEVYLKMRITPGEIVLATTV